MNATEQAKAYALEKTGLNWSRLDKWSDKDRTAYLAALAEFRNENAHLFTPDEMRAATNYAAASSVPAPEFSYFKEFVKETGARVTTLNSEINPFMAGSKIRSLIIAAILVAAVVYFGVLAIRTSPRRNA